MAELRQHQGSALAVLQHCHGSAAALPWQHFHGCPYPVEFYAWTILTPLHQLHYFENGEPSHHKTITALREQRHIRIDFNNLACLWDAICYTFWNMGMPRPCFGRSWCHCVAPGCIKGQITELCPHPGRPFAAQSGSFFRDFGSQVHINR